jgi:hypothetical protein
MKLAGFFGAIAMKRNAVNSAFQDRFGVDLLRLLAFNFGHALTLNMPGLGSGNCNACLLHSLLFFGLRKSTGQATYHALATLYGHIAGISMGMATLFVFPQSSVRLLVFAALATLASALMQNAGTNFFGLICIIFLSSTILANWETPYEDIDMDGIYSDFYGTCAAVATNVLFHLVYPMPSSRNNLFRGLAERIRSASHRASQYSEHLMQLYASTDRDYRGSLTQDDSILASCIGPEFEPYSDIFQMRSELNVTQREVDAAHHMVQAVDSLFIAVEAMALPLCHREVAHNRRSEPRPKPSEDARHVVEGIRSIDNHDNLQTFEDVLARDSATARRPISCSKWRQWRDANYKTSEGKLRNSPRFLALHTCHSELLLELSKKLELACESAPVRRFPRVNVDDLLARALESLLSDDEVTRSSDADADRHELLSRPNLNVLSGAGLLDVLKVQSFYDSIEKDFLPLFTDSKFNHIFSNDLDSATELCGINGMQLLQETAMCIAPFRCWCSIAAMLYTVSSSFEETVGASLVHAARSCFLRFLRILAAPVVAVFELVLIQLKKAFKNPKKFWKKHFRRDMGNGLFMLKFGIGLLLLNVPVILVPGADDLFNGQHGSWIVFSFMFCLDKTRESSLRSSLYRLMSTAAAGFLGLCAVFMLNYSFVAFNLICTVGIGCIAGSVKNPLRQYMSTFLSAFIVCVSCPIVYGAQPSYSTLLLRIFSVVIGGSAAVFVSSFLWPISAYKRAQIEIATSVKRITQCLLCTEPYFIGGRTSSTAASRAPSSDSVREVAAVAIAPVSARSSRDKVDVKHWLREHLRNEISVHELEGDSSQSLVGKTRLSEISDLLSDSFFSLRRALRMIQMIEIVQSRPIEEVMSRVETQYCKIDQVREMLFSSFLLHLSVSMSVQACFRPPVTKIAFDLGFYESLRVLEHNYNLRSDDRRDLVGDFERAVKSELKHVIVLLQAWELKVWPKHGRTRFLADTAACVANNHCLVVEKEVDARVDRLTSSDYSASSSVCTTPSATLTFTDHLANLNRLERREVCSPLSAFDFSSILFIELFPEHRKQVQQAVDWVRLRRVHKIQFGAVWTEVGSAADDEGQRAAMHMLRCCSSCAGDAA